MERISLSQYRNNFILKGGMLVLVASVVGLDARATMDIDTTVKSLSLSKEHAQQIVENIIPVEISDGLRFRITKVTNIMEEHDYPGVRFFLEATLDQLRQTIKIDISTGDVITPCAIEYQYPLMFEDRSISLWTYNLETLLAEKLETIMARGIANTRLRDFYDIHILTKQKSFDENVLKRAFLATSEKRNTVDQIPDLFSILLTVEEDKTMQQLWNNYREDSFFVGELPWREAMNSVKALAERIQ